MIIQLTTFFPWGLLMNIARAAICFNIIHAILKDRYNLYITGASIFSFTVIYAYLAYIFIDIKYEMLQMAIYYILLTVLIQIVCRGNIFIKIFSSLFALLSWVSAALLFSCLTQLIGYSVVYSGLSYELPLIDFLLYLLFMYAFSFVYVLLINSVKSKISREMQYSKKYTLYFIFPVTHIFFTMLMVMVLQASDRAYYSEFIAQHPGFETALSVCALACIFADFLIIFMVDRQSKTENDKIKYEKQLLKSEMDYQQTKMLTDEKNEFRKLKHDLANLLSTAQGFIEIGKPEKALEILQSTESNLNRLAGVPVCSNETINTVFYIKQQAADELKVKLNIKVEQTSALHVDDYSVCRIMHNLLDNSLYAAGNSDKKYVDIKVTIDDEYFKIICRNPYSDRKKLKAREGDHGHGINIIKDIAKKYSGSYKDEKSNGIYTSKVKMKNSPLKSHGSKGEKNIPVPQEYYVSAQKDEQHKKRLSL